MIVYLRHVNPTSTTAKNYMQVLDLVLVLIALFIVLSLARRRMYGAGSPLDRRPRFEGEDGDRSAEFAKPSAQHPVIEIGSSNETHARKQSYASPQIWRGNDESEREPAIGNRTT